MSHINHTLLICIRQDIRHLNGFRRVQILEESQLSADWPTMVYTVEITPKDNAKGQTGKRYRWWSPKSGKRPETGEKGGE